MCDYPTTLITVHMQGSVHVKDATVFRMGDDVAIVDADLDTKYCRYVMTTQDDEPGCGVFPPREFPNAADDVTTVTFPQFKGWEAWLAEVSCYTLWLCLIKPRPGEEP